MAFQQKPIQDFIGKGITFPIVLENGKPKVESGFQLIRSSIAMILTWPYGTRFFLGEFGSRLEELLEEPNDEILKNLINVFVVDAINDWEKRVELLSVTILDIDYKTIHIGLRYKIINTQLQDNYIFPFYRQIIN